MKFKRSLFVSLLALSCLAFTSDYDDKPYRLAKVLDDDDSKYTNVGNLGLTVTNFGTYGHGFAKWPDQPSCEYPLGSGIEHIFDGGLWIGAFISQDEKGSNKTGPFVSTGAVDASSTSNRGGGFEFTNGRGEKVVERSSLTESKFYNPNAISHRKNLIHLVRK